MSSDNVVVFPKSKKDSPPQTMNEVIENIVEVKTYHAESVTEEIMDFIHVRSAMEGFNVFCDENSALTEMIGEAVKSALLNSHGIENWMVSVANDLFDDDTEDTKDSEQ